MNVVWILNPKTQEQYAIASFEDAEEALDYKDKIKLKYPSRIFFFSTNGIIPETIFSIKEAIALIDG